MFLKSDIPIHHLRRRVDCVVVLLFCLLAGVAEEACAADNPQSRWRFSEANANQLTPLIRGKEIIGVEVDLQGVVLWADPAQNRLILQTTFGAIDVWMDLAREKPLALGESVRLAGNAAAGQGRLDAALVNNDGMHSVVERSGIIFLTKGRHPICGEWFNGRYDYVFEVDYAGPGLRRQPIPASALSHKETHAESAEWRPGLNFRCFHGFWQRIPHWADVIPARTGVVDKFDLEILTRNQEVGVQFEGYLQVEQAGYYTFWTKSDDGSRVFLGGERLHLDRQGNVGLPRVRLVKPGQALDNSGACFWAETEGVVTGVHLDLGDNLIVEMSDGANTMNLEIKGGKEFAPALFTRVRSTGVCQGVRAKNGLIRASRMLVHSASQVHQLTVASEDSVPPVTSIEALRRLGSSGHRTGSRLRLTGTVVATRGGMGGLFAFEDDTDALVVRMDGVREPLEPGQRVVLSGMGVLEGNTLLMGHPALVDNDGVHLRQERTGTMYLREGRHPIHLLWFNRVATSFLEVSYQGPGLPRQKIPASALSRAVWTNGLAWQPGLNYSCYNGDWQSLPVFSHLMPVEMGIVPNFDFRAVANRAEKVGVHFSGYLDIPRDGQYFFYVSSDDGSLFYIDQQAPSVARTGMDAPPAPVPMAPRQAPSPSQNHRWMAVEGTVTFGWKQLDSLFLEINSVYGPMNIEVVDGEGSSVLLLLGSRVRVEGFCQTASLPGGQATVASMSTLSLKQVEVLETSSLQWDRMARKTIGELIGRRVSPADEEVVRIQGMASSGGDSHTLTLQDETGSVDVNIIQPISKDFTGTVDVVARVMRSETNVSLCCGLYRKGEDPGYGSNSLPVLTSVGQVKQLTREQARKGYPAQLRGVITHVRSGGSGFILQDDTAAIDVWWTYGESISLPRVGDYWSVEGRTFAGFAPNVRAAKASRLGLGVMPEPLHPAWDQLLNGSLDTRYIEIQGIVTEELPDGVILLTQNGRICVRLPRDNRAWVNCENALVRVRGCVVPIRDEHSQQVQVGEIRLSNISLSVDEVAPADLFQVGVKRVKELLLFDARASSLQRVRVAGQVMHARGSELFLLDETNALRVILRQPVTVAPGDLVEAVGFTELGSQFPVLREARVRKTGNAPMPEPERIPAAQFLTNSYEGLYLSVEARLLDKGGNLGEKFLAMQMGSREFTARVDSRQDVFQNLIPGSMLALTGVYSGLRDGENPRQRLASFELLLNSPSAVRVLTLPPWWTLHRALAVAAGLLVLIVAGMFWIALLRRRVEERTVQLAEEIRQREQAQQQSLLEKERIRIAKDMHDQLGTNVTQIGLLAELTKKNINDPERVAAQSEKIFQTAFDLGRTLDEIVWAVNPRNDALDKFCDYIAFQAQELFQLTDVLCRVDLPPDIPSRSLSAEVRHNLFLAAKEALNNAARHARASEVWVRFTWEDERFEITISDDGAGFDIATASTLRNGLANMKKRLEDIGGSFSMISKPGRGTSVTLSIPLHLGLPPQSSVASHGGHTLD